MPTMSSSLGRGRKRVREGESLPICCKSDDGLDFYEDIEMGRLILVNFAIGAVGTPVAADFKTTEGVRVILPSPSVIKPVSSSRAGIAVVSDVELELPAIAKYITVAAYAGADSPRVDYIAPDGSLVASHVTAKGADQLVQDGVSGHAPVARLILRGFDGEGILLRVGPDTL